jgi:hypothetical protein
LLAYGEKPEDEMAQYTQTYVGEVYEFETDGNVYRIEHQEDGFVIRVMDEKPFYLPQTKPTFEYAKEYAEGWFKL